MTTALNTPSARRANNVSVEVGEIDAPTPGQYRNRTDDQGRPDTALDEDGEHARRTTGNLRRTGRPKQMLDRAARDANRERQGHDDQEQPKARHRVGYPEHPQQNDADRQRHVERAMAETAGHGRRRCSALVERRGPAPHRLQRDGEEPETEHVGDELAPFQRPAESVEQPDPHPAEGEPADEHNEPPVPKTRGHRTHRNDAEPLVTRGQQEAADNDGDTQNEKGDQQPEQHLA